MRKSEYLDLLRFYLQKFPKEVIDDIIQDYEEHFAIGIDHGKTEEEIAEELGSPRIVAEEYLEGNFDRKPAADRAEPVHSAASEEKVQKDEPHREYDREKLIRVLVILGVVVLLGWLLPFFFEVFGGLLGAMFALVFGLCFGLAGLSIGSVVLGITLIINAVTGLTIWQGEFFIFGFSLLTKLFFGLGFIGLGMLLMMAATKVMSAMWTGAKKLYYYLKWQVMKRRSA